MEPLCCETGGTWGEGAVHGQDTLVLQTSCYILRAHLKCFPIRKASKSYVDIKNPFLKCTLVEKKSLLKTLKEETPPCCSFNGELVNILMFLY